MIVLAQINFSEMPKLSEFPESGILQIFLAAFDDLYGWDGVEKTSNRSGYHVRYFPNIESDSSKLVQDFSFLPDLEQKGIVLPGGLDCRLAFDKKNDLVSISDSEFQSSFTHNLIKALGPLENRIWNWFDRKSDRVAHQIGGSPDFVQADPRGQLEKDKEWVLLFQMDSDDDAGILWGDSGIGNFSIVKTALERQDFSDVRYEYACY